MQRKRLMTLILFLLVILIVAITIVLGKNKPVNNSNIEVSSVSYYHGGSSIGDSYSLYFSDKSISMSKCEGNGMDEIKKKVTVDDSFVSSINELVNNAGMIKWTNLKTSDIFAYDAPSTSVSITFNNGKTINIGTYDIIPNNGWDRIDEMVTLMEKEINR